MTQDITQDILDDLFEKAKNVRENAYAPYSRYPVGAALLAEDGKTYLGVNCESATFTGLCCAERGAIANMVTHAGPQKIRAIAVVAPNVKTYAVPCGICRQQLREFSDGDLIVYCASLDGHKKKRFTLKELLPESFGPEHLDEAE